MLVKQRQRFSEKVQSAKDVWAQFLFLVQMAFEQSITLSAEALSPLSEWVEGTDNRLVANQRANAQGAVNMLVVVGATLIVGIVVYAQIESATPSPDNEDLATSQDSVTDTIASSFDLASVLPIVIIAGAILFFLRGFGGGNGMGRR